MFCVDRPKPIQSGDHQGVPLLQGEHCLVELRPRRLGAGHPVIDIEVITPDSGREQVLDLPVGVLSPGRDPRVSDELAHDHPAVSRNQRR